ncbi:zinc-dependent peptidase [bacterium]|nr:zinc-dependent peptidase [bacterium]MBU1958882.1 zinc-dependent peptidase [bacterium]
MVYSLLMIQFMFVLIALFLFWQSIKYFRAMWRYKRIKATPFPTRYRMKLQTFSHYNALSHEHKSKLHILILLFLDEKEFIGVQIEITEEMRVLIAFYASLMHLGFEIGEKNKSQTIIIYPEHFVMNHVESQGGIAHAKRTIAQGESANGTVVLSWHDIQHHHPYDNVIIHEFAHELDFEDGFADGVPDIHYSNYRSWSKIFTHEFLAFQHLIEHEQPLGKYTLLGNYAATNGAEFFAVCSERFFLSPAEFKQTFEELYQELMQFYQLDTVVLFET